MKRPSKQCFGSRPITSGLQSARQNDQDFVPLIAGKDRPVVQQQQQVQPLAGAAPMANDDDPPAPYKLYDGDERIGTYRTRAEARRAQQKLESEAGSERRLLTIKDNLDRIVL
jgi:hypothetical protein